MKTWHEFKIKNKTVSFSWDGRSIEEYLGSAESARLADNPDSRRNFKRSFSWCDATGLARLFTPIALDVCDALGVPAEYRAAVADVILADATYAGNVTERDLTADEVTEVTRLTLLLSLLAANTNARIVVRVNRNHDPPVEWWSGEENLDGEWGAACSPEGSDVFDEQTLAGLAREIEKCIESDAPLAESAASSAAKFVELARDALVGAESVARFATTRASRLAEARALLAARSR